jgi:hypothetical protein
MAEQTEKSKVVDIGEWKKNHGLASPPYERPAEDTTGQFVNKFLDPKLITSIKRPPTS